MPDGNRGKRKPRAKPETRAKRKVEKALKESFASIQSEEDAAQMLEKLERESAGIVEADFGGGADADTASEAAEKISEKALDQSPARPAKIIRQVAREIAKEPALEDLEQLDWAVGDAARSDESDPDEVRRGRRLLRKELYHRLRPLQAMDAIVFSEINSLPHPRVLDRIVSRFSFLMTGGHAFAAVILLDAFLQPRRARKAAIGILPALWLTTYTVEHVIKRFFRRRRPFISIVRAIVVGRRPGSYSFPSGHSASAFAAATLLALHYPQSRRLLFSVAGLVAFSRIYLGAHYPGDVLSGSVCGAGLARAYRALFLVGLKQLQGK
jgi:undecaprenyl-diphosphatase